jgi:hypothetical protein
MLSFLKKITKVQSLPQMNNFLKYSRSYSSHYVNHRDTNFNNDETPFDFTSENYKKIDEILVHIF